MKVYICDDHAGRYPVGVCSVVVANEEAEARSLLIAELKTHGLDGTKPPFTLRRLNTKQPKAFVIRDGDY